MFVLVRGLHAFLSPTDPVGGQVLVVEGWMDADSLDQAVALWSEGTYEQVVTTGAPMTGWAEMLVHTTYAEMAAKYLVEHGVPAAVVTAVPAPESAQDRTFLSAVMVREWAKRERPGLERIDLLSTGVHARRSRMMYRAAFGDGVEIGVIAARPGDYDPDAWWTTSGSAKATVGEALGYVWTWLFFHPPPPGSHEERWAVPPRPR